MVTSIIIQHVYLRVCYSNQYAYWEHTSCRNIGSWLLTYFSNSCVCFSWEVGGNSIGWKPFIGYLYTNMVKVVTLTIFQAKTSLYLFQCIIIIQFGLADDLTPGHSFMIYAYST